MADSASSDANPSGVQGVCPSGWQLAQCCRMERTYRFSGEAAAGKMKETGTAHWGASDTTWVTNSSGFTALPVAFST